MPAAELRRRHVPAPRVSLSLVLTHACNLACSYCSMGEHHATRMPDAVAERAVDLAFATERDVDLGFFGGEPLIEHALLERTARRTREIATRLRRSLRMRVTTNGLLLDARRLATLRELGVRVTLSIDGVLDAHDAGRRRLGGTSSHGAAVRAAKLLAAEDELEVISVVTPSNVRLLADSVAFLVSLGARNVILNPDYGATWTAADLEAWEDALEGVARLWSGMRDRGDDTVELPLFDDPIFAAVKGGLEPHDRCVNDARTKLAVAPSGRIYPCDRLVREDRDHRFVIGHVDDASLDRARSSLPTIGPDGKDCSACPERFRCGAHCACSNFAETGSLTVPGAVHCWFEQTRARIADRVAWERVEAGSAGFVAWAYGARV
jgi:uncharacterized protein